MGVSELAVGIIVEVAVDVSVGVGERVCVSVGFKANVGTVGIAKRYEGFSGLEGENKG